MPRSYVFPLPKKMKVGVLRAALTMKRQEGKLVLLDDFPMEGFKTRQVLEVLRRLRSRTPHRHRQETCSSGTVGLKYPGVQVVTYVGLNVYDILDHEHLILLSPVIQRIQGTVSS
jgi:large subunit ribosomal protein L4